MIVSGFACIGDDCARFRLASGLGRMHRTPVLYLLVHPSCSEVNNQPIITADIDVIILIIQSFIGVFVVFTQAKTEMRRKFRLLKLLCCGLLLASHLSCMLSLRPDAHFESTK